MTSRVGKIRKVGWFWPVLMLVPAFGSMHVEAAEVHREVMAMGTRLAVSVTADDTGDAWLAAESAVRAVEDVEARLSSWRADSDVSRINRAEVGQWIDVSLETTEYLSSALKLSRTTVGTFHPGIGAMVEAWLSRTSRGHPEEAEIEELLAAADLENLEIHHGQARRLNALFSLNAGAFGKGVALKEAAEKALEAGPICIDLNFGGQVMRAGRCDEVRISIADPRDRWSEAAGCFLKTGSLATSGNSERGKNGVGHIIDPRTGRPSPFGGSVTVLAVDPVVADCLSTALFVMGSQQGRDWLESNPGFGAEAVWISADGEILWTTHQFGRELRQKDEDRRKEAGSVGPSPRTKYR